MIKIGQSRCYLVLKRFSLTKPLQQKLQSLNFLVWKVPSYSPTPLMMVKPVKEKQIVHNTQT